MTDKDKFILTFNSGHKHTVLPYTNGKTRFGEFYIFKAKGVKLSFTYFVGKDEDDKVIYEYLG